MSQITICIWEVGLQLEGRPVRLNGLWDVPGIFMDRGQVRMGVSEGRIDLDGPGVALQRPLDVVHFFQGVAHVAVSIGESGLKEEIIIFVKPTNKLIINDK